MNSQRPRILFLTTYYPYGYETGGNRRSYNLFRALEQFADVDIVMVSPEGWMNDERREVVEETPNFLAQLEWKPATFVRAVDKLNSRLGHRLKSTYEWMVQNFRPDPAIVRWRKENLDGKKYDAVVVRSIWSLCKMDAFDLSPILLDLDDLDHFVAHGRLDSTRSALKRMLLAGPRYTFMKEQISRHAGRCAHALFTSEEDIAFCPFISGTIARHPPTIGEETPDYIDTGDPNLIVQMADWLYPPYNEAMVRFLEKSWPLVKAEVPGARLRLLGRILDADRTAWSGFEDVEVLGVVPYEDIHQHYRDASFSLALGYYGNGCKTKVLESLLFGKPVVVTHHCHHGYRARLKAGESLLVGINDAEIAAHCVTLLKNQDFGREMAARGREVVKRAYNIDGFNEAVRHAVGKIIADEK